MAHGHVIISKSLLTALFTLAPAGPDQATEKKRLISLAGRIQFQQESPRVQMDMVGGLWCNIHLFGSWLQARMLVSGAFIQALNPPNWFEKHWVDKHAVSPPL